MGGIGNLEGLEAALGIVISSAPGVGKTEAGLLPTTSGVARGGVEPPTFRFSEWCITANWV
jgi:hypothetical protein